MAALTQETMPHPPGQPSSSSDTTSPLSLGKGKSLETPKCSESTTLEANVSPIDGMKPTHISPARVTACANPRAMYPPRPSIITAASHLRHTSVKKLMKDDLSRVAVIPEMKLSVRNDIRIHPNGNIEVVNETISSEIRDMFLFTTPRQNGLRRLLKKWMAKWRGAVPPGNQTSRDKDNMLRTAICRFYSKDRPYNRPSMASVGIEISLSEAPTIQFPEAIVNMNDLEWKNDGKLSLIVKRQTASKLNAESVLWLPDDHPFLRANIRGHSVLEWATPPDIWPVLNRSGMVDITRNHIRHGRWVWITRLVDGLPEVDFKVTGDLEIARTMYRPRTTYEIEKRIQVPNNIYLANIVCQGYSFAPIIRPSPGGAYGILEPFVLHGDGALRAARNRGIRWKKRKAARKLQRDKARKRNNRFLEYLNRDYNYKGSRFQSESRKDKTFVRASLTEEGQDMFDFEDFDEEALCTENLPSPDFIEYFVSQANAAAAQEEALYAQGLPSAPTVANVAMFNSSNVAEMRRLLKIQCPSSPISGQVPLKIKRPVQKTASRGKKLGKGKEVDREIPKFPTAFELLEIERPPDPPLPDLQVAKDTYNLDDFLRTDTRERRTTDCARCRDPFPFGARSPSGPSTGPSSKEHSRRCQLLSSQSDMVGFWPPSTPAREIKAPKKDPPLKTLSPKDQQKLGKSRPTSQAVRESCAPKARQQSDSSTLNPIKNVVKSLPEVKSAHDSIKAIDMGSDTSQSTQASLPESLLNGNDVGPARNLSLASDITQDDNDLEKDDELPIGVSCSLPPEAWSTAD